MVETKSYYNLNHSPFTSNNFYEYIEWLLLNNDKNNNKNQQQSTEQEEEEGSNNLLHQHLFIRSKFLHCIEQHFIKLSKSYLYERYYDTEGSFYRKQNIWFKIVKVYNENDEPTETYFSQKQVIKKEEQFTFLKEERLNKEEFMKRTEFEDLLPIVTFKTERTKYQFENVILNVDKVQGLEDDFNYNICVIEVKDLSYLKCISNWKDNLQIKDIFFGRPKIVKFMEFFDSDVYKNLVEKKFIEEEDYYQDDDGDFLEEICDVEKLIQELVAMERWDYREVEEEEHELSS
ncbi:hypothetical protein ABK040_004992 [Willaertia magna]